MICRGDVLETPEGELIVRDFLWFGLYCEDHSTYVFVPWSKLERWGFKR